MKTSNKFQPPTRIILDQLEMIYYLYQVLIGQIWEETNRPFNHSYIELTPTQASKNC